MFLTKQEKLARLRILRSGSVGVSTFWNMIQLYESGVEALLAIPKLQKSTTKKIVLQSEEKVLEELMKLKKFGARMVFLEDELYPPLLRNIPDPPPVLTFFGNKERIIQFYKRRMISIVGSRNSSIHANKFCLSISEELGKNDVVVVSGLARGIDACAHQGSLKYGTIAVLAGGIDVIYPQENAELYRKISEEGGIFTETPYGVSPQAQLFPRRNRIIAGMSYGTVVVEAAVNSGSLITARFALEYNREVFAVPNFPMDPRSIGCNSLLKEGATLVRDAQDVLDSIEERKILSQSCPFEKNALRNTKIPSHDLAKTKKVILEVLSLVPITIDELISYIKVSPREALTALLELELAGKIVRMHGQRVCLTPNAKN